MHLVFARQFLQNAELMKRAHLSCLVSLKTIDVLSISNALSAVIIFDLHHLLSHFLSASVHLSCPHLIHLSLSLNLFISAASLLHLAKRPTKQPPIKIRPAIIHSIRYCSLSVWLYYQSIITTTNNTTFLLYYFYYILYIIYYTVASQSSWKMCCFLRIECKKRKIQKRLST